MDLDIVLVNDKVKPAICKAIDQKENLYKRFINDVLKKDYERKILFIFISLRQTQRLIPSLDTFLTLHWCLL
jgi:hypothetical protein